MASTALIVLTLCALQLGYGSYVNEVKEYHGFCLDMLINKINVLHKLYNCTVILGDLKLQLERTKPRDFDNVSFPNLKEVTGCVVIYGAPDLESVGGLFPNLMRVRGNTLINDYALIISNMPRLREIGLANLLKVDRGGIIIWPGPLTCYVDSVNWRAIAPNARHVLSGMETYNPCKTLPCTCTTNSSTNFCWNNKKCQRFLEGPEAEKCSPECVGCLKRNGSICSLCRHHTYQNQCVDSCPNGTIPLTDTNYCVTIDECTHLERWLWNNTCASDCPQNYVKYKNGTTCVLCDNCDLTCNNLTIQTLTSIQGAARCVYIKGYLSIHVRAPPETMNELRYYLKSIQEVTDYIEIRGSLVITSLDFLPALKRIKGENLYNDKYSLLIHDMQGLQSLFPQNVTRNLKVDRGSVAVYRNQMLCMSEIEKLVPLFPVRPTDLDIPQGLNGYSGSCFSDVLFNFTIQVKNETNAVAMLYPESNKSAEYIILYVKVPDGFRSMLIPEVCNESDWHAVSIQTPVNKVVEVELSSLNPATTYAICIEEYDPESGRLARSSVKNFSTAVGKPEPPFIVEITASSSEVVVIRWVDHLDYLPFIVSYELDVTLIDNVEKITKNHCSDYDEFDWQEDFSVHARVMRPPQKYDKSCESMCGVLSKATVGAMVDEYFDVCNILKDCDQKPERPLNKTVGNYVKNLALNINGKRKDFQVGGLAPYRDYRFQLRACTDRDCSISSRNVVKTLRAINADVPTITFFTASEKGDVSVKWEPPKTINGAVLSYTVEVTPVIKCNDYSWVLPHTVCVSGNITSLIIKTQVASKYVLRLCMKTLASSYSCGERVKVLVSSEVYSNIGIFGALFAIFLCVTSVLAGWRWKKRDLSDDIPLVAATSIYRNESEPPAVMMSDFAPIYSIPLSDTYL